MELQTQVRVYNETLGIKGAKGKLVQVHDTSGYYEIALEVKERYYEALMPISGTVLLASEPITELENVPVERF